MEIATKTKTKIKHLTKKHCSLLFIGCRASTLLTLFQVRHRRRQILCQSVQLFRSSDTPSFSILHRFSWSPLQQCKHYRATLRQRSLVIQFESYCTNTQQCRLHTV